MNKVEFFLTEDFKGELIKDEKGYHTFSTKDQDLIDFIFNKIQESYPTAFARLKKLYGERYDHKYRIVKRFIRCNFGLQDNKVDIDELGNFCLERVRCPMYGECADENVICNPEFNTSLTPREKEVLELIYAKYEDTEIADNLFISYHTAVNHRRNILKKLNCKNKAEIIDYVHKNNLEKTFKKGRLK